MQVGDSHDRMLLVSEYTNMYSLYIRGGETLLGFFTETKDLHISNNRAA